MSYPRQPIIAKSSVRKLTPSCLRCKASKLKCNQEELCVCCLFLKLLSTCFDLISNVPQDQGTGADEVAWTLQCFVDGASRTNAYPSAILEPISSSVALDYPNTSWSTSNDPKRQDDGFALIRGLVDNLRNDMNIIHLFYEVFVTRCQGPLSNIIHTPAFTKQAGKLCRSLGSSSP